MTMKVQSEIVRKTLIAVVASVGLAAAAPSFGDTAQNPPAAGGYGPGYYGMGPGMMGGYGPGYGYGQGRGYGNGQGRGYGYGPGYGMGYGMGPWMMGGYGPGYGMGPGMMWGYGGGWGMGPGMMWGGYGPGMMGSYGYGYNALDLSDAQRQKIEKIQEEAWNSQWEIMNKMHEAISQRWVEAQKKIDAVLTKEQREQLRQGWGAPQ
jgi:Spy/CpxP family protein refolding chaperone